MKVGVYVTPCGSVIRETLAFVVEHFARTSNFRAGPEDEGKLAASP